MNAKDWVDNVMGWLVIPAYRALACANLSKDGGYALGAYGTFTAYAKDLLPLDEDQAREYLETEIAIQNVRGT